AGRFAPSCDPCSVRTGSFMPSRRLADHSTSFTIWRATHIAWRFPITGRVTFRWKDYARGDKQRLMTVTAEEFLRRFLLHTLPRGFVRIRSFGFLANRRRGKLLPLCRQLLAGGSPPQNVAQPETEASGCWLCPCCGGAMALVERLTPQQMLLRAPGRESFADTS